MVEYACTCDGLPPHSHNPTGRTVPGSVVESGPFAGMRHEQIEYDPFGIRMWVDWKAVAKAFATDAALSP